MVEEFVLKLRIKFSKQGHMRFIGHLDIMRYFQKAIRRAGIDIAYSEGFSPHQKMSFASPLGVGTESFGEYFDIEANSYESSKEMVRKLNAQMVEGMRVLSVRLLPEDAKNGMSVIAAADYKIDFEGSFKVTDEQLSGFLNQESITVMKKTKKSEKEVDIRPLIYGMSNSNGLVMKLSAGSVENLKPELVINSLFDFLKQDEIKYYITRMELYADNDGDFISLEDLGEEIG